MITMGEMRNTAASGSAIVLAPGTYNLNSTLMVPGGVSLSGQPGVVFNNTGSSSAPTVQTNGDNIRVDGITFNGNTQANYTGTLVIGGDSITISNNTFNGSSEVHIYFSGLSNALIASNSINGASNIGLMGYVPTQTQIVCNTFVENNEELHLFWGASGSHVDNVSVSHNIFRRSHRYTMELQGGPNTVEVAHNWVGDWLDADIQGYCLSTTLSIATGGDSSVPGSDGQNVTVHDNVVGDPPSGALSAISSQCGGIQSPYELMGANLSGWNNYEWGAWTGGGPLVGFTTPAWTWFDNERVGSGLSAYPPPQGENGYQAPAPGNYANNRVVDTGPVLPDPSWAFTDSPP